MVSSIGKDLKEQREKKYISKRITQVDAATQRPHDEGQCTDSVEIPARDVHIMGAKYGKRRKKYIL